MATNYPSGLDAWTNPAAGDGLASPSHAAQHANVNDAVEAVQAELGTSPKGSAASVKARLEGVENGSRLADGAVSTAKLADAAVTSAKLSAGLGGLLTTKGDLVARDGSTAVRLPVGADGTVLQADAGSAAGVRWGGGSSVITADTTSGAVTLTLPPAALNGHTLRIVKTAGANTLTVQRAGSDTIIPSSGSRTSVAFPTTCTHGEMMFVSNGTVWIAVQGQASDETVGRRLWKWEQALAASSTTAAVGWQLVYADTGVRDISASLINSWTAWNNVYVRRVLNEITLFGGLRSVSGAATSNDFLPELATGFKPQPAAPVAPVFQSVDGTVPVHVRGGGGSPWTLIGSRSADKSYQLHIKYHTVDPWPASLPGSASGSIPT